MRCPSCKQLSLALKAFEGGREIWACQQCEFDSLVLDCHFCERRGVLKAGSNEKAVAVWHCGQCSVKKHQCPSCSKGWVMPAELLQPGASGLVCDQCQHSWSDDSELGSLEAS